MHVGVEQIKEAKVQTLRNDFKVIHMKDDELVDDFAMKLTTIITDIRSLGDKVGEISIV